MENYSGTLLNILLDDFESSFSQCGTRGPDEGVRPWSK